MQRILVLGGSGYVGQNICHRAITSGKFKVVQSLSRSGQPKSDAIVPSLREALTEKVEWIEGDIFDQKQREEIFSRFDCIISTIGAFGSNEFMEKMCGDATIEAARTAADVGVSRFGFISSAQVGRIDLEKHKRLPLYGYFKGKTRAEDEIQKKFPDGHVILRPGFIYGSRVTPFGPVPLNLVGAPIDFVSRQMGPISSLIQSLPFVGTECASMVPVTSVAESIISQITKSAPKGGKILTAEDIRIQS